METKHNGGYAITTCSYYGSPNDFRLSLALETIKLAKAREVPFVTADNSPGPVQKILVDAGALVLPCDEGVTYGEKRRRALGHVLDGGLIAAVMEPEKSSLIPFLDLLAWEIQCGADMVIPWRRSLDSYPSYQRILEPYCNWEAFGIIGGSTMYDLWSGIRIIGKGVAAQVFRAYHGQYGNDSWDSMYAPVPMALHAGAKIVSVPIDYVHPLSQKEAEEGDEAMDNKRRVQRDTILACLRWACKDLRLTSA